MRLSQAPAQLCPKQRDLVDSVIRQHCEIRGWYLHAVNVRTMHVHVVVSAEEHPDTILQQFKAWATRRLNEQYPLEENHHGSNPKWWTEHGSTKWINDEAHLMEAIDYVLNRQ